MLLFVCLLALSAALVTLDLTKALSLTRPAVALPLLLVLPHGLMLGEFLCRALPGQGVAWQVGQLIVLGCLWCYLLVRLHLAPNWGQRATSLRLGVMLGGRRLILYGLWALAVQVPLTIWLVAACTRAPLWVRIADPICAAATVFLLLLSGVLRIFFTSRRLSIWRRVLLLLTVWVPFINLAVLLYCCHIVWLEYDHETYRQTRMADRIDSQLCRTRYPLVLVHGVGFRDLKYFNYWGRIPRELLRNGAAVYYGHQQAWGTIEENAAAIKTKIEEVLRETGCEKVNVIAHSKGGLDARYMISRLDMAPYVASLTTISSPHRGSRVIDWVTRMPEGLYQSIARVVNHSFRRLGDTNPDFYTASRQFRTDFAARFNEETPNAPGVYYQSYTSVMKHALSDSLLCIPYGIVYAAEGANDGLVSIPSATWGEFQGVLRNRYRRGISHGDIIDLKREDYRGFDVLEFYVGLVDRLRRKGF